MTKLFWICACFIGFSSISISQNCNYFFKGKVIDFHDNSPISGATIHILNSNKHTFTNDKGEFEFSKLCLGNLTLEIRHIGCETKRVSINLTKNIYKEFLLEHHLEDLNEVIVKANGKNEKTGIESSIKIKTIENFSDKSLGDALKTISGVNALNTGNSIVKPMIHGLHSSRLLLINNNVRMFDQEWGDEHAPNIDINANNRIDVIKGANTLKYGSDAIGGMILVKPKKYAVKDSIFGNTLVSFNSNGLGSNINSEIVQTFNSGLYGKLQFNVKKFGDFNAPDYNLTNSGLNSLNTSFKIGYNSFEKGFDVYYSYVKNNFAILQSSHIGNVNDLVSAINNKQPRIINDFSYTINNPKQSIDHHLGKIEAYKRFKGLGKLTMQYDFQINRRKEFDLRRGALKDTPVIDLRLFTNSLQTDFQLDYSDKLKINSGLLARYQQNDAVSGTGTRALIPDFDKYELGFYTIANFSINESTELNAGLRYDYINLKARKWYNLSDWNTTYNYDELFPSFETGTIDGTRILTNPKFTFHNFSTSLGMVHKLKHNLSLIFNYGLASRVPNPSELFSDGLHHSAARIEIGLLSIDKEIANKMALSIEKNDDNFGFSLSPFYKHINNFIQLIPTGITTTIRGAFPVWQYNQINAQIFGLDLDVNKKISNHLNYSGSFSWLRGSNISEDIPLIHMPAANFGNRISYSNKSWNQFSISLIHKTVLQQNRFPDYNFNTFNAIEQQNVFVDISSTPPTYSLLDVNTSITLKAFHKSDIQLNFNIENLLNTSYREHLNRLRYFSDEIGRNFNLKIKINY